MSKAVKAWIASFIILFMAFCIIATWIQIISFMVGTVIGIVFLLMIYALMGII